MIQQASVLTENPSRHKFHCTKFLEATTSTHPSCQNSPWPRHRPLCLGGYTLVPAARARLDLSLL